MPSVTEVLDYLTEPELLNWYRNNSKKKCEEIGNEAKRVGSLVDSLIQQDIKEGGYLTPEGDIPVENCLRGWEKFKKDYPEFVLSVKEMQTELRDGELIGHPDFIHLNGITDLKCASGIRPRYWTQTAKYLDMKKILHRTDNFIAVLRLEKTAPQGLYEYKKITDQNYIYYEIKVFQAYHFAFNHNVVNREQIRLMLEKEMFDVA